MQRGLNQQGLKRSFAIDFQVGCTLQYDVKNPTAFVFNFEAARFGRQVVRSETLNFTPTLDVERFTIPESSNRIVRAHAMPGPFRVEYRAEVTLNPVLCDTDQVREVPASRLPFQVLTHLNPSRYCQSDRLALFAQRTFGGMAPGHQRIGAICNWICDHVDYRSGTTDAMTSAADTLLERQGVCRDFAHLAVALCRALGVPARYVSAYAWRLEPPDFHAVFEAWLQGLDGGAWYLFDATRKSAIDGLVRIGVGRDAGEVAFCSIFGASESEAPRVMITGPTSTGPTTSQAVSTAAL